MDDVRDNLRNIFTHGHCAYVSPSMKVIDKVKSEAASKEKFEQHWTEENAGVGVTKVYVVVLKEHWIRWDAHRNRCRSLP